MKLIIKTVLFTLILLASTNINAQKADVKLSLNKGDVYNFRMEMNNIINQEVMGVKMAIEQNINTVMTFEVNDVLGNGNYMVEQTYKRVIMDMTSNGQNMSFDTDIDDASSPLSVINKLKEVSIKYELSPKGDISNITGYDELLNSLSGAQQTKILSGILNKDNLSNFFSYIPDEKMELGGSYTNTVKMKDVMGIEVTTKYVVEDISSNKVILKLSSDIEFNPEDTIEQAGIKMKMKGEGIQVGSNEINLNTGMLNSGFTKQNIDMNITMKNPQTNEDMSIQMKIDTKIKVTVIKQGS